MNARPFQSLRLLLTGALALVLSSCSTLFDSPSQEGVQIVRRADQAIRGSGGDSDIPAANTLDLTYIDLTGNRGSALTSSKAVRDLQDRPGKTPAERELVQAINHFNREQTTAAKRIIDPPLMADLRLPADRALAHMYRGFILCYEYDRNAGAGEFRRMYAEVPEFVVTEEGPGYSRWSPVLNEVTAQLPASSRRAAGKPGSSRSTMLVSKTADGSSQLLLNVFPGGSIVFDGQRVGESPPVRLIKVSPGVHSLLLTSSQGEPFAVDVDIGTGERIEIRRGTK